jgi:hypothetical protein
MGILENIILAQYQKRVNHYTPLISKKTGVYLDTPHVFLHVKPTLEQIRNRAYENLILKSKVGREEFFQLMQEDKKVEDAVSRHIARRIKFEEDYDRNITNNITWAYVEDGMIFTKDNLLNIRASLSSIFKGSQILDEVIVHELGHILYDRIKINYFEKDLNSPFIQEGYATYCETTWFSEFYPSKRFQNLVNIPEEYRKGEEIIKKLVEKHGEKILLKIPNRKVDY